MIRWLLWLGLAAALVALGCGGRATRRSTETVVHRVTIEEALRRHSDSLMAIPGVVGVAQGEADGEPVIQVLVIKRTPALDRRLPRRLEGYRVITRETGEIRALESR